MTFVTIFHNLIPLKHYLHQRKPLTDPESVPVVTRAVVVVDAKGLASLLQVQATVVGFLAAVAAVVLGWIPEGKFQMNHAVLLCSSSVATAFIASLLQGKHAMLVSLSLISDLLKFVAYPLMQ